MSASPANRFAALPSRKRIQLLRHLVEAGRTDAIPGVVPPRATSEPVRLSPAQHDLWVYESLYPNGAALNLCCAYHLRDEVGPAEVEAALTIVYNNHDVLRTRIGDDLRAHVRPAGPFPLERADLRGTPVSLADALQAFSRRPFDLTRDRLVRGCLITVDGGSATLVLALHHIITDWWSFDVLHNELAEALRSIRDGTPALAGRPAIQYADFAEWQRELDAAGVFEHELDFWLDYLREPPEPLRIGPAARTGPRDGLAHFPFRIPSATEKAVRAFARTRGVSVYAVLMTAFAVVAHRLSGADDFLIGTPIANRSAAGLRRVIGFVTNALPVRWRIHPDAVFTDLLHGFTAEFADILANAQVPSGRIVSACAPRREAGRSPLFRWVFMYLQAQEGIGELSHFARPERVYTGGEHDLVVAVQAGDDGLVGSMECRTDVLPAESVAGWGEVYATLLDALVAESGVPVSQVDMLPATQRRLVSPVCPPESTAPARTFADLVGAQANTRPDAVAVESADGVLTYAELLDRAQALAGSMRERGVGPERIVALVLPRSVEMVTAAVAVHLAGGAFLAVDPDYPAERVRFLLDDAAPVLVVTSKQTDRIAPPCDGWPNRLLVDGEDLPVVRHRVGPAVRAAGTAAYVCYTSGSTGRPKGVVLSHTGTERLTADLVGRFALDPDSRIAQLASPSFDIWVAEVCMAFGSGGTLVVAPPGPLAGDALGAFLRDRHITCTLIAAPVLASVPPDDFPSLRVVCAGADVCPPELAAAWRAERRTVFNGYGPTEDTVATTVSDALTGDVEPPIGRPVQGTGVHVLDAGLCPVPVGVPGELYVTGAGLARGYLRQPGRTAERFVADPFVPGGRMYRTGDRVRWSQDGQLHFLGRTDQQVKVNGFRIEPGEVESVLAEHPAVARAVVVRRDGRLAAYVVPRTTITEDDLLRHTMAKLPAHLVPDAWVTLAELPTTPQGKLDRAALPDPRRATVPRASATEREQAVCELFDEVLRLSDTGPHDSFFALGGDSILALRLVSLARSRGIRFSSRDVFNARTPARLAAVSGIPAGEQTADDPVGRLPLTPLMRWWRGFTEPRDRFVQSILVDTPPGADADLVAAAVRVLVDRHDALRMRLLCHRDRDWELEIPARGSAAAAGLTRVDAGDMDEPALRRAVARRAETTRIGPESGRMLDATWFDTGRGGPLLLCVHHLAVDQVSWHILEHELGVLLAGGDLSRWGGTSFRRWVHRLHEEASSPERVALELPVWRAMRGREDARLVPEGTPAGRRATISVGLDPERTRLALVDAPAMFGCGPAEIMLAALAEAVDDRAADWGERGPELLVEIERHGRDTMDGELDLSGTVGWFTAQHPLLLSAVGRCFWHGGDDAATAVERAIQRFRAIPGSGVGYGMMRYLNPATAPLLAELPAPDLRFNYLGRATTERESLGMAGAAAPLTHNVELDALVDMRSGEPRLTTTWSYATGTAVEGRVRALADTWCAALDVIAGLASRQAADRLSAGDALVALSREQIDAIDADLP